MIGGPVVRTISGSDARNSITGRANYLIDETDHVVSGTTYPARATKDQDDEIKYQAILIADHIDPIAEQALPKNYPVTQTNSAVRQTNSGNVA